MTTEPIDWNDRDHLVVVHTETGERWEGERDNRARFTADTNMLVRFNGKSLLFRADGTCLAGPYCIENGTADQRLVTDKPFEEMSLAELETERAHWQSKIDNASGWGAAVGVAAEFVRGRDAWIAKRKAEAATPAQRPDDIPQSAWDASEGRSREDVAQMIAALYLLKQRACAAHKLCYELMLDHPGIAELDDNGTLHQAIHDILRVETPVLAAYRAEREEG